MKARRVDSDVEGPMGELASVPDEIICVLYDHENVPLAEEPDEMAAGEGATSAGTTAQPGETAGVIGAPMPDGVYFVNTLWGGTDGDDVYEGGSRTNAYFGAGGADSISGLGGDDGLLGGAGRDTIDGGAGHDFLGGNGGDDQIHGGAGRDFVWGGGGDDILRGGKDDDFLLGGIGDDRLTGGLGRDRFLVHASGEDVILDFDKGADRLDFSLTSVDGLDELEGLTEQRSGDLVITFADGDVTIVKDATFADLNDGNTDFGLI